MHFTAIPILAEHAPDGFSCLAIEVGIIGGVLAQDVDVALVCNDPTVRGKCAIDGKEVNFQGRSYTFRSDENGPQAGRRRYYLPGVCVDAVKVAFDIVSSDEMHVQVLVDGEKKTIGGKEISAIVDEL